MAKKKSMNNSSIRKDTPTRSLFGDLEMENSFDFQDPDELTLAETKQLQTTYIDIDKVIDNRENRFEVSNTFFLEQSILKLGQLQPILVVHVLNENGLPTGKYEIKAGSRRFLAITNICKRAKENNDEELYNRFSKLYVTILPMGITDEEIQTVITETNTTVRQISIEDLFKNFDIVFEKDEDGNFKYLSPNGNKYEEGAAFLKQLGYSYSPSSCKDYLTIYLCSNPKLRKNFEDGFLSKRQSLIVARMDQHERDEALDKFDNMESDEVATYLKNYATTKKEKKKKAIKGIELITTITKMKSNVSTQKKKSIVFLDKIQKEKCMADIHDLMEELENLAKAIDSIEI